MATPDACPRCGELHVLIRARLEGCIVQTWQCSRCDYLEVRWVPLITQGDTTIPEWKRRLAAAREAI